MFAISAQQMRNIEQSLFKKGESNSFELMKHAGQALAYYALKFRAYGTKYAIFAGKGNNAGDGFIAANVLHDTGHSVNIYLIYPPDTLTNDALRAFKNLSPSIHVYVGLPNNKGDIAEAILIDCLLGTGFSGSLRAPYSTWIEFINQTKRPVIATDIPSGLNTDTGDIDEIAVNANMTVTFGTAKKGLLLNHGPEKCGKLVIADIGIPECLFSSCLNNVPYITDTDIRKHMKPLNFSSYKHKRGHVLIIGGSAHYPFAPLLSGTAALRCTAGMVTVFRPYGLPLAGHCPYALIVSQDAEQTSPNGVFSESSIHSIYHLKPTAIAVGMGIGLAESAGNFLEVFLRKHSDTPLLLDADALTLLANRRKCREILRSSHRDFKIVLTPHEGEMKRLESACRLNSAESPIKRAVNLAIFLNSYVIFKGPRTIIATPAGEYVINISGSSVLATAGSGDVLSGILISFLASGFSCFDACKSGVYIHGVLGELAQKSPFPLPGLIADDFISQLPEAFLKIMHSPFYTE